MKLALLVKRHKKVWIFLSVSSSHTVEAIPTRHHLFRGERWVHKETASLSEKRWILSEYYSFEHIPKL